MSAALTLAFAAGMVATLNPCGFAMLPAYLSYFMGIDAPDKTRAGSLRSGLMVGGVVSVGFVVVFGLAGVVISAGFRSVTTWIPWLAVGVGVLVIGLGIAVLAGWQMTVGMPKVQRRGNRNGYAGVFGFGVSYAVASLSCTLPVFLSVVATQLTARSFFEGIAVFLAYGLGMSVVLVGITIVLALGKQSLVHRLRSSARYLNRLAGAILIAAGGFIVWFWTTEIRSGATALASSRVFRWVENLSQTALNFVADNTIVVATSFGALIVLAVLYTWWMRTGRSQPSELEGPVASASGELASVTSDGR